MKAERSGERSPERGERGSLSLSLGGTELRGSSDDSSWEEEEPEREDSDSRDCATDLSVGLCVQEGVKSEEIRSIEPVELYNLGRSTTLK